MSTTEKQDSIVRELDGAIHELQGALQRAAGATATIKGLLPRIEAVSSVFDEIEGVIQTGRRQFGAGQQAPATFPRPTLVVPSTAAIQNVAASAPVEAAPSRPTAAGSIAEELTRFRLEFESSPGPLDLRAVDDAVSEHPAVRDVALLDYDGRKATLKVWIVATASPADVREALTNSAANLFPGGNDVTIVALEDVA